MNLIEIGRSRFARSVVAGAVLVLLSTAAIAQSAAAASNGGGGGGDPGRGKALYQACAACHSIDENDVGPKHRGVVGRRAGSVDDYPYSAALKLPPTELAKRLDIILDSTQALVRAVPDQHMDWRPPERNRTLRNLGYHVFRLRFAGKEIVHHHHWHALVRANFK